MSGVAPLFGSFAQRGLLGPDRAVSGEATDGRERRLNAVLSDAEQMLIRVVPGVTGLVVGRSRELAVGLADAPIGLSFQLGAVARGTVLLVGHPTHGDLFWIVWIGAGNRRHWPVEHDSGGDADGRHASYKHRKHKRSPLRRSPVARWGGVDRAF